jgi:hypothetical protein
MQKVTLYSFWAIAVRNPDPAETRGTVFRHHASATLMADGFQTTEIELLLSRTVIGSRRRTVAP